MAQSVAAPIGEGFKEAFIDADGFHIRYREAGQGNPLICFHGAGGLRISRAHEILAEGRRVIVFEAPGFGQSAVNDRSKDIIDLASTMANAIANMGIDHYDLMGTSFGGRLGIWLAINHADRIRSLVLMSPAAITPAADGARRPPPSQADLLVAHPERQPPRPPVDPAVNTKQSELVMRLAAPSRGELEAAMEKLDLPVLVLFATLDKVIPPEMGRVYRDKLPRCNLIYVYDAGHAMDIDRPEAVASVVGEFLERGEGFIVSRNSALIHP